MVQDDIAVHPLGQGHLHPFHVPVPEIQDDPSRESAEDSVTPTRGRAAMMRTARTAEPASFSLTERITGTAPGRGVSDPPAHADERHCADRDHDDCHDGYPQCRGSEPPSDASDFSADTK